MRSKEKNKRELLTDKAAEHTVKLILKCQEAFSNRLYSLTGKWKKQQQRIFLFAVCVVMGSLSVVAILQPFYTKKSNSQLSLGSISMPKNIEDKFEKGRPKNRLQVTGKNNSDTKPDFGTDTTQIRSNLFDSLLRLKKI